MCKYVWSISWLFTYLTTSTPQKHYSVCRHEHPSSNDAYPTPTPTAGPSSTPDEDVMMEEEEIITTHEPSMADEEMEDATHEQDDLSNMSEATLDFEDDHDYEAPNDNDLHNDSDSDDGETREDGPAGTEKAGWSQDMTQTTEMETLGICVNTVARVVVCLSCSSVVKPSELASHLKRLHKVTPPSPTYFERLVDTYNLHEDPLSSRPGLIINAIYGLPVKDGYYACDTCGSAFRNPRRAKMHVKDSRGRCKSFEKRHAQTYLPSSGRMYFGVDIHPVEDQIDDPLDALRYIKTKFAQPQFRDIPITSPESSADANHFLTIEPWLDLVKNKTGGELHEMVRERQPELRREVRICMERYARAALKELESADNEARSTIGDYLG